MSKIKFIIIAFFFGLILINPFSVSAAEIGSQNYRLEDQIDFGGGVGNSSNYQEFGFLTDQSSIVFWPYYASTTGAVTNVTGAIKPTDILSVPVNAKIEFSQENILTTPMTEFEVIMSENILGDLNVGELVIEGNLPLVSATAAVSMIIIVLAQLANIGLLAPFTNFWAWILSLFGIGRKSGNWGVIYDAETQKPVVFAVVQLFEKEYNKLVSTQTTDKDGRFSIIVKPGTYTIKVIKSNYFFPSKLTTSGYHGADIVVKTDSSINYEIPIDPDTNVLANKLNFLNTLVKVLNIIRIPLLVIGSVISVLAYVMDSSIFNFVIILVYVIVWLVELYKLRQLRPYGLTMEKLSFKHLDMVILRLFDERQKLVSTKVSDGSGKFRFLTNPGKYYMTATKQDYNLFKSAPINFNKSGGINFNIYLEKNSPHMVQNPEQPAISNT